MKNYTKPCDLCGLAVEIEGFKLDTQEGDKQFCCEGCLGIYQMLHEDTLLTSATDKTTDE